MQEWFVNHNMQCEWMTVCSNNRRNLIDAAKYYLKRVGYQLEPVKENPQLEVFIMTKEPALFAEHGFRGLVRLTKEASCTKGIGREDITTTKFFPHFDFYLRPKMYHKHFIFTREEK